MSRRHRSRRRAACNGGLTGVLAVTVTLTLAAAPAVADPVPGATYNGMAADGANVTFTVSPDGTLVDSYRITNVIANGCQFTAEGDKGVWEGAPIVNNAFSYQLGDAIFFQGTFPGAQSASGTFRLHTGACETGTVAWTVKTTANPPPPATGGPPGTGGGGGGTGSSGGGGSKHVFVTRVTLRKLSSKRLGGRISSPSGACRAGATVILWRGQRRFARTKTKANGTYWFARSNAIRGRRVRASVLKRTVTAGVCAAGSSTFTSA